MEKKWREVFASPKNLGISPYSIGPHKDLIWPWAQSANFNTELEHRMTVEQKSANLAVIVGTSEGSGKS